MKTRQSNRIIFRLFLQFILVSILFFPHQTFSQTPTLDSLFSVELTDTVSKHERILLFEKYLKEFEKKNNHLGTTGAKLLIGLNLNKLGSLKLAQNYFHDGLSIIQDTKDSTFYGLICFGLGNIYKWKGENDLAINYLKRSLSFAKRWETLGQPYQKIASRAKLYNSIGIIFDKLSIKDSSEYYYNQSLLACEAENDLETKAFVLINLTMREKNHDNAISQLKKVLEYFKSSNKEIRIASIYKTLATKHLVKGENDIAQAYLDSCKILYVKHKYKNGLSNFNFIQADLYARKGDFKTAFLASRYAKMYSDSIENNLFQANLKELGVLFEINQKQKTILEKESNIKHLHDEKKIKELQLYSYAGGSGFIIIIMGLVLLKMKSNSKKRKELNEIKQCLLEEQLFNRRQKETRLQNEIQLKKKYLTDLATDLSRNYEFTEKTLSQLKSLKRSSNKDDLLKELILNTSAHQSINENLKVLWNDLNDVSYEFIDKLRNSFPNLSKFDLHMCGLIHLDLSNKEISTVKNVNPQSVRQAKTRLRKKLGITGENDFREFLIGVTS